MKNLIKSFFKTFLKNWIQLVGFIVFIIIAVATTIGLISTPLQINNVALKLNLSEKKWNYQLDTNYWNDYEDNFIYDYFQNKDKVDNYFHLPLLNLSAIIYVDNKQMTLNDFLQLAWNNIQKNNFTTYNAFVGNVIKNNVFSFSHLYEHKVVLPNYKLNQKEKNTVLFNSIVTDKWANYCLPQYGQLYHLLNQYLVKEYNKLYPNNKVTIEYNYQIKYSWRNPITKINSTYCLEPINVNKTDNVVSNVSNQKLLTLKNDEILVNDKFANINNFVSNQIIQINNFITLNSFPAFFSSKYKVVGYGMKSSNLFLTNQLQEDYTKINSTAFIYMTNKEIKNYLSYLYFYDNRFYYPDKSIDTKIQVNANERLFTNNDHNLIYFYNYLFTKTKALTNLHLLKYNNLSFVQMLNFFQIEAIIFIIFGCFLLILAMLFINYCLKKELNQIIIQLGIFKALGYRNVELITIIWLRVILLLFIGFILGFFISFPIQIYVNAVLVVNFLVMINPLMLNFLFILITLIIIPIGFSLFSFISLYRYLSHDSFLMVNDAIDFKQEDSFGSYFFNKLLMVFFSKKYNKLKLKNFIHICLISLLFFVACILLLLQFNAKNLVLQLLDRNLGVYNNIDNSFNIDYHFPWTQTNNVFTFEKVNQYNITFQKYNSKEELTNLENKKLEALINKYVNINRNNLNLETKQAIETLLLQIGTEELDYNLINFNNFYQLFQTIVFDYNSFLFTQFPEFKSTINLIKNTWIPNFDFLNKRLHYSNPEITFNNIFYQYNIDYPILKINLYAEPFLYKTDENWKLYFIDDYNKDIFSWTNIDKNQWQELEDNNIYYNNNHVLPVIITNHFAKLNNLGIGAYFSANFDKSHFNSKACFKIVGINKADNYTNNLYADYNLFKNNFLFDNDQKKEIYNAFFSRNEILSFDKNISLNQANLNVNYFSFYFPSKDKNFTLLDIFANFNNLYNFITWNNLYTDNFESFSLESQISKIKINQIVNLLNIFILFTIIILLILFLVTLMVILIEMKKFILILKAYGYHSFEIIWKILRKYLIGIIVSLLVSFIGIYFFWKILLNFIFTKFSFIILNPFSSISVVIICLMFFIVIVLAWVMSYFFIKRKITFSNFN